MSDEVCSDWRGGTIPDAKGILPGCKDVLQTGRSDSARHFGVNRSDGFYGIHRTK
jgi:hypothetical protein